MRSVKGVVAVAAVLCSICAALPCRAQAFEPLAGIDYRHELPDAPPPARAFEPTALSLDDLPPGDGRRTLGAFPRNLGRNFVGVFCGPEPGAFPNGDDAIPIGTVQTVRWSSVNLASNVRIELSRDGGRTYELLFADWPNTGSADWTVTGPETFQALLRVTSLADSAVSDLSDYPFTIGAGISPRVGERMPTVANESAVTPQENLVIGTVGKLQFAQNRITVRFEAMGSVYTRDMRANEISVDSLKLPNFLKDVYKPRVGTNADFALNGELGLALESVSARVGYKFIGPGY